MAVETPMKNEGVTSDTVLEIVPSPADDAVRKVAQRRLERVRKFKLYLFGYVLAMFMLTPLWVWQQYETSPGWLKHLSTRSRYPGDWDPWIIWVALVGAVLVVIAGYRAYLERPTTDAAVEHEAERSKTRR